jgi:hypothetical protein
VRNRECEGPGGGRSRGVLGGSRDGDLDLVL